MIFIKKRAINNVFWKMPIIYRNPDIWGRKPKKALKIKMLKFPKKILISVENSRFL